MQFPAIPERTADVVEVGYRVTRLARYPDQAQRATPAAATSVTASRAARRRDEP